ncbi:MAG: 2Fe-2S iron-sulfur cluster-binding protein, partial [Nitrospirota bacterium]
MNKDSQRSNIPAGPEPRASSLPSAMTVTIDGHRVVAEPGDTVYQAAKKAGIAIPSLCASDQLNPFGSCRLCLCEIEGQSGTVATCTTPV